MQNKGLLSMPPNSPPANPTHGGTAASQTLAATKTKINIMKKTAIQIVVILITSLSFQSCEKSEEAPVQKESPLKIYMRSSGNDENSGLDFNNAVQSLKRVQDILYDISPKTDIEVHINQGTYLQQGVKWTFSNGKKITFTPIDFSKDRPVFDGEGKERWFWLQIENGTNTNLNFRYIKVINYKLAVYLDGNRDDPEKGWNGGNHFYQMHFENIGNKYSNGQEYGVAVIDFVNSRNNTIKNCYFINVENLTADECAHIHALYLAHYSSNNEATGNIFKNICGDPIRTRDESNFNKIERNTFSKTGSHAFYSDWFCNPATHQDPDNPCTKLSGECPSYGNEFRDNDCDKDYLGNKPNLFRLYGDDNFCGQLPNMRLRTSGNVNH
jgi:hypothetical protein